MILKKVEVLETKRGNNVKKIFNWRGNCPICRGTGIKLIWDKLSENGTIKVCKICGNK